VSGAEIPWVDVAKAVLTMGRGSLPPEEFAGWLDALAGTRTHDSDVASAQLAGPQRATRGP